MGALVLGTTFYTVIAAVLALGSLVAHEAAHGVAMRRYGVAVAEAGLGLPIPPRILIRPYGRRDFPLSVSPWLIGAYVRPDPEHEDDLLALPYRDQAWWAGAGVVANLLYAGGLLSIDSLCVGHFSKAVVEAALTVAVWFGRRVLCAYVIPVLGLPVLVFLGFAITGALGKPQGPVGVAIQIHALSTSLSWAVMAAALVSLSVAIVNVIPVYPMDGGRIAAAVVKQFAGKSAQTIFQGMGVVLFLALVVVLIGGDALWLLRKGM